MPKAKAPRTKPQPSSAVIATIEGVEGFSLEVRDHLAEWLAAQPRVSNVRLDYGNVAFDYTVGEVTVTRLVRWGLGKYADGNP